LTDVIRAGTTTLPGEGTVSHDNPIWVDFAKQMAPMIFSAAAEIADLVVIGLDILEPNEMLVFGQT